MHVTPLFGSLSQNLLVAQLVKKFPIFLQNAKDNCCIHIHPAI